VCRDVTAQRSTEQALELARTRLDSALSAGEVATFVWETDHNRLYGDANFERMFRVKLGADGSAPLESYLNVLHPEDRMRVQKLVEESVATGQDYEAEYRIVQPDETHRWVIARAKVERGDDGGVTRFTGVVLDVTARKRAEEAQQTTLRELERQWRIFNTILSSTADFAYLLDREGRFLYANRRLLELFGRKLEDVVGKNFRELDYEPWHAEMHMREVAQVFETGKRHVSEVPYRGPTGIFGVFEYIFEPVLGLDGEVEVIAGTTHDITESKRAREALEARERHLSFIIEAAQLGTFDWELPVSPGRINWNDRLRGFFWLEDGAVVAGADTIESRVHPADREKVRTALERAIRGDSRYDVEYRIVGPAGQLRWVHASGQSYEGVDGEIKRFSGVVADITPSKLAAEERERLLESERAARAEAERTSRMKDEFLATLSHELRTPLNAILGWAQVLRSETPTAEDLVQGLSTIERNARAQTQIIEDLLDMSRIISGKVRLDIMRIDLVTVLEQAIETVRPAAAARGIRLQPTLDRRVGPISGDPNRLQQVFWNLLSNAIKFTPRNGRVQILLERVNSHLEVSVVDSGEGIAPEFLPHVFDRFRQQDASTTRRHGGLGLGLAIVKQLVELHGGTVAAHSRGMGEGATFRVALPLRVIEPEEVEERRHPQADFAPLAAPEASIRLDGVTVLVVDDEPDARGLVKRLLQDRQARVLTAGRASEALALLRSERPDVLVSDIGMPEEDGYTLIRKVRALDAGSGGLTPAIALTAYARAEDRMKAILAGFQMHVSKPVEAAELLTMVASLAGKT
jgi:PAS domain S-box-containing protein